MSLSEDLAARANQQCELCAAKGELSAFEVPYSPDQTEATVALCETCKSQIESGDLDVNHWRCLNDSMWSPVAAVQVMAWRMLKKLENEVWAQELLDMMYLDDELSSWAKASTLNERAPTYDSNGALLQAGDSVVIIKDLDVKGTSFVAKRGTAVRNIGLTDNPNHIEGRVNGTRIVILTQYVKKS